MPCSTLKDKEVIRNEFPKNRSCQTSVISKSGKVTHLVDKAEAVEAIS